MKSSGDRMYGLMENGSAYDPRPRQALAVDEGAAHSPPPFPTGLALDPTLSLRDFFLKSGEEESPSQIAKPRILSPISGSKKTQKTLLGHSRRAMGCEQVALMSLVSLGRVGHRPA